jgi:hypothetical protein
MAHADRYDLLDERVRLARDQAKLTQIARIGTRAE